MVAAKLVPVVRINKRVLRFHQETVLSALQKGRKNL